MAEWALIESDLNNEDGEIREAGMRKLLELSEPDSSTSLEVIEALQALVLSPERSQPEQEQAAMCLGHLHNEDPLRDFCHIRSFQRPVSRSSRIWVLLD